MASGSRRGGTENADYRFFRFEFPFPNGARLRSAAACPKPPARADRCRAHDPAESTATAPILPNHLLDGHANARATLHAWIAGIPNLSSENRSTARYPPGARPPPRCRGRSSRLPHQDVTRPRAGDPEHGNPGDVRARYARLSTLRVHTGVDGDGGTSRTSRRRRASGSTRNHRGVHRSGFGCARRAGGSRRRPARTGRLVRPVLGR